MSVIESHGRALLFFCTIVAIRREREPHEISSYRILPLSAKLPHQFDRPVLEKNELYSSPISAQTRRELSTLHLYTITYNILTSGRVCAFAMQMIHPEQHALSNSCTHAKTKHSKYSRSVPACVSCAVTLQCLWTAFVIFTVARSRASGVGRRDELRREHHCKQERKQERRHLSTMNSRLPTRS